MSHPFHQKRFLDDNLPQRYQPGESLARWHQRKAQLALGGQPCEVCGAGPQDPCSPKCTNLNRLPPKPPNTNPASDRFRNRMFLGPRRAQMENTRCNCENTKCQYCGGRGNCSTPVSGKNKAMYVGDLCDSCAQFMPAQYMIMIDGQPTGRQAQTSPAPSPKTGQYGIPGLDVTDLGEADKQVAKDWLRDDALNVGECNECGEEMPLTEFFYKGEQAPVMLCKRCFAYASMHGYGDMAMQQGMEQYLKGGQRMSPPQGEPQDDWFMEHASTGKTRWIKRINMSDSAPGYVFEVAQATEGQISMSVLDVAGNRIIRRQLMRGRGENAIESAKAMLDAQGFDWAGISPIREDDAMRSVAKVAHPVWDIQAGGTLTRKLPEKTADEGEKDTEMPQAQPMMGVSASLYLGGREVTGSISKVASDGTVSLTTADGEVLNGIDPAFIR